MRASLMHFETQRCVWPHHLLLEAMQIGEPIDGSSEVVSSLRFVDLNLTVSAFRLGSAFPTIGRIEDEDLFLPLKLSLHRLSCSIPSSYFRKRSQGVCSVCLVP
jgi:hypothetical protein